MKNLPLDIVEYIIKFLERPRLPYALSHELKIFVSNQYYKDNLYFGYTDCIKILSIESLQIIRKKCTMIELVLRNLNSLFYNIQPLDLQCPYIDIVNLEFLESLSDMKRQGLSVYDHSNMEGFTWSYAKIGGIDFFLNWSDL